MEGLQFYFRWQNFARAFQNEVDNFYNICGSEDIVQTLFYVKSLNVNNW